jgi:hypothetical protein
MRIRRAVLILAALGLAAPAARAEPVYRCVKNGKTVFTDSPSDPSCQPLDLKVQQPDPAEVARIEEQKRIAAEQDRAAQEQAEQDRVRNAQIQAAQAEARAANAQRRWTEQQIEDRQFRDTLNGGYGYGYGYGYGGWPGYVNPGYPVQLPYPHPLPPLTPFPPGGGSLGPQRPTPNYPYPPSQMSPAGR